MTAKRSRSVLLFLTISLPALFTSCNSGHLPDYPAAYREYAYVTCGTSNTVAVLDLVNLRPDRVLAVGQQPTGITANPVRNELYAVNTASGTVSVIDAENNRIAVTIGVHHLPYFIDVSPDGHRAYVANSGSNSISILDLDKRREIAVAGAGEGPGVARVSPDNRFLVVSNRIAGSVSIYAISSDDKHPLQLREAYSNCPGATDVAIAPNSLDDLKSGAKAFIACSGGHQVMDIWLAATPDSWGGTQNPTLQQDHLLALLDVGQTPVSLALKPIGGELYVANFDSNSISEINTTTNEVGGAYTIGSKPTHALIGRDNTSLWVSDFGADSVSLYSIDDGRLNSVIRTGPGPDALAFSADQHLLLVADAKSGDIAVLRTDGRTGPDGRAGPQLFTMLPAAPTPNTIATKAFTLKH